MGRQSIPKYKLLSNWVREQIQSGNLREGEKLGTEKEYAVQFGVSRHTVRQAIATLESEGMVLSRHGSGTYVHTRQPRLRKTMTVGFIASLAAEGVRVGALRGMEQVFRERGYALCLSCTHNRWDIERMILEQYLEHPVDGLIVEATKSGLPNPNLDLYQALQEQGTPLLFLGNGYEMLPETVRVRADDCETGGKAVEYLAQRHKQRIGGIFLAEDQKGMEQYRGFSNAIIRHKLPLQDDQVCWVLAEELLSQEQELPGEKLAALRDCQAVVCGCDEFAIQVINYLLKQGIAVPQEVAVLSLDYSSYRLTSPIALTSITCSKERMGELCSQKLLQMMQGEEQESEIVSWQLVQGESV